MVAPPSDAETSCNSGVQAETCPYLRLLHVPFLSDVPFSGPFICPVYQLLGAHCTVMCVFCTFAGLTAGRSALESINFSNLFLKFIFSRDDAPDRTLTAAGGDPSRTHRMQHGRFGRVRGQVPKQCWDTNYTVSQKRPTFDLL